MPIPTVDPEGILQPAPSEKLTAVGEKTLGDRLLSLVTQALLMLWAAMVIFPFVWMIYTAFKSNTEILFSPWDLPSSPQWSNFSTAWTEARIGRYALNSVIVVAMSLTGTLLISSMAASWPA
jgi:N-acetylglucosamine transport system permease protein